MEEIAKRIAFLDSLLRVGEEPQEIIFEVEVISRECSAKFGAWLTERGLWHTRDILPQFVPHYFEYIYLVNWSRSASVGSATKRLLGEYLPLIYFEVEYGENPHFLNPYDALLLLYRFLAEVGYAAEEAARIQQAIGELRQSAEQSGARVGKSAESCGERVLH